MEQAMEPSAVEQSETPQAARRREILARILMEKAATELDPTAQWQDSIDLAAVEALDRLSNEIAEQAGVIFRNKATQQYAYSVPVRGSEDNFSLRAKVPQDHELAGIYHTHGPDTYSGVFSPSDVETAQRLRVLSFIKHLGSGDIRRFDPAKTRTRRDRSAHGRSMTVAEGDPVERPQLKGAR